jgi:hypothetical protein
MICYPFPAKKQDSSHGKQAQGIVITKKQSPEESKSFTDPDDGSGVHLR